MTLHTAVVAADGHGWMITLPELDRVTYAPHPRDVAAMTYDLIEIMTDTPADPDALTITWPADIQAAITSFAQAQDAMQEVQRQARAAMANSVHSLKASGNSYRDIAAVLGLSHQRVAQLAKVDNSPLPA